MTQELATVQKIEDIQPIEGADTIEKVKVLDVWCISQKGTFKKDDLCVYVKVDSLLPIDNHQFDFLSKSAKTKKMIVDGVEHVGYHLRLIKLRGQVSQGLAMPIEIVKRGFLNFFNKKRSIGDDVSEQLRIVKYETT